MCQVQVSMKYLVVVIVFIIFNFMYNFFKPIPDIWSGEVIRGYGNASTLDWPTANIRNDGKFPVGVFTATSEHGTGIVISSQHTVEFHIHKFSGDLYDKHIKLEYIRRYKSSSMFNY